MSKIEGELYKITPIRGTSMERNKSLDKLYKIVYLSEEPIIYARPRVSVGGEYYSYILDFRGILKNGPKIIKIHSGRPVLFLKGFIVERIGNFEYTKMDLVQTISSLQCYFQKYVVCEGLRMPDVLSSFIDLDDIICENYSQLFSRMTDYIIQHKFNVEST